ncbi:phosphoserine / homoserine phosphotransferase [Pararobbsia alpina]|uniref:bifunctional phosphoserine phosphatase/homoserine phosphotransferase ThrH n=1 Tax=Pararobbsia alpina TaxID=621374 RepID=UPI0039A5D289
MNDSTMKVACIDLEGVLMPELWPHLARQTGIEALALTTRDEPDYRWLMRRRISALRAHRLKLRDVQAIVAALDPLPDAVDFLERIGDTWHVRVLSDCFFELAQDALVRLGNPVALCHRLVTDSDGFIVECAFAERKGKEDIVQRLVGDKVEVLAVGDAHNDIAMLRIATHGFLLRPSEHTRQAAPDITVVESLGEVLEAIGMPLAAHA